MIRSMTAFARQEFNAPFGDLVWELRSVNHRYLEAFVRLPEDLRGLEQKVREAIAARLKRGKVEAVLRFRASPLSGAPLKLNLTLVDQLAKALRDISIHAHDAKSPTTMDILRWPGVVEPQEQDADAIQAAVLTLLDEGLEQMIETRRREGERLSGFIGDRLVLCRESVVKARERMPTVLQAIRERLETRLGELKQEMSPERLEQELVILAQRLDVDEEMDRLTAHLDEMDRVLTRKEPVGRRLDFLTQEMNREANTLASKSADTEMTAAAVELKVLIEQIREQVQNIE
jgi:uncharacterized protein (TIGR00255 family)